MKHFITIQQGTVNPESRVPVEHETEDAARDYCRAVVEEGGGPVDVYRFVIRGTRKVTTEFNGGNGNEV